jgi:CheY-like chemotaxis protein
MVPPGHQANVLRKRPGSSQLSCHNRWRKEPAGHCGRSQRPLGYVSSVGPKFTFEHFQGTNPDPRRYVPGRQGGSTALSELPVILVAEDDQAIQGIVEEALSEGGFELAIAASGEEAVILLSGNKGQYQALVTDIGLRGRFDGWEVARRAREINPGFPIVYMSGRHAEDWASKGVPNSIMLAKPFAPAQLVTAVSQLLNTGTPTT